LATDAFTALTSLGGDVTVWIDGLTASGGSYLVQILRIIWLDILLAGDNAVVIALACRSLPPRQRRAGIVLGAGAAVMLRILFTIIVSHLFGLHWLKLAGGLALLWIAVKLLIAEEGGEDGVAGGTTLWEAVRIVAIADMVMSIDNVLAVAAAAHGDQSLIIFGLVVSIPLVVGGATLITSLLTRFPILVWAGAALLGWVAGELIASEPAVRPFMDWIGEWLNAGPPADAAHPARTVSRIFEVAGAILVCAAGYLLTRRRGEETEA
jgi:YjbE family integral membrane protein